MSEHALFFQHRQKSISLRHSQRNGEESRILIEFFPADFPLFLIHFLKPGNHHRQQLHDNGSGDIRPDAEHHD